MDNDFALQQEKYMIEDQKKHLNKLNRMSNAEIMVALILFYYDNF